MMNTAPTTRKDCLDGLRPCPWIRCRYHLIWIQQARLKKELFRRSDDKVAAFIVKMSETCVLDLSDRGGMTLEEIAFTMQTTRERVRQIEGTGRSGRIRGALYKLRKPHKARLLIEYMDIERFWED